MIIQQMLLHLAILAFFKVISMDTSLEILWLSRYQLLDHITWVAIRMTDFSVTVCPFSLVTHFCCYSRCVCMATQSEGYLGQLPL